MKMRKTRVLLCIGFFGALLLALQLWLFFAGLLEREAHWIPDYAKVNLSPLLERSAQAPGNDEFLFTPEEYRLLYRQTGLGQQAVDKILKEEDGVRKLTKIQDTFFREQSYTCIQDNWLSRREQTTNPYGAIVRASQLTGLEDGDILVTKCSHVLGWQNGHAAIVTDAEGEETVEAIIIGENTAIRKFKKWEKYPNYVVLRLSDASKEERAAIARWAKDNLLDIPYQLTAGFFGTKGEIAQRDALPSNAAASISGSPQSPSPSPPQSPPNAQPQPTSQSQSPSNPQPQWEPSAPDPGDAAEPQPVGGTQCAHLIWRAYAQFGYDLDSNGGWIVTPKDLANCPDLEVVQVYGMDPDDPWP